MALDGHGLGQEEAGRRIATSAQEMETVTEFDIAPEVLVTVTVAVDPEVTAQSPPGPLGLGMSKTIVSLPHELIEKVAASVGAPHPTPLSVKVT